MDTVCNKSRGIDEKTIALGWLITYLPLANATNTIAWSSANQAYNQGNLTTLAQLSQTYPNDQVITYLNAAANLSRTNPTAALEFIQNNPENFFGQILIISYLTTISIMKLGITTSLSTTKWNQVKLIQMKLCGYDITNFALGKQQTSLSDFNYLIANKMPLWCISLIASKLNNGSLDKSFLSHFV